MTLPQFTKAHEGRKNTPEDYTRNYRIFVFTGGSCAWRNNNPGNLRPGDAAKRHHSPGKSGGFSVFQDYETSHDALIDSLKSTFGIKNLSETIAHTLASEINAIVSKSRSGLLYLRGRLGQPIENLDE